MAPNNGLLTGALSWLRCACGAAKRGRRVAIVANIRHILAALLLAPSLAVGAEVTISNLLESLQRLNQSTESSLSCADQLKKANRLNAANLFFSAGVCFREKRSIDGAFLLLAGQIRSTTDFELFEPREEQDKQMMGTLWGILFYRLGGAGDVSIYRNPDSVRLLFDQLANWKPIISETYDPGWHHKAAPASVRYSEVVETGKEHRRHQLESYSRLIADEGYYAAQRELDEIQARNPRGIDVKSEDGKRSASLMQQMRELEKQIQEKASGGNPRQPNL